MTKQNTDFLLIDQDNQLDQFVQATRNAKWIAFDTEFVGEKRYQTLLCLVQVACEEGYFLLDPIRLNSMDPFLELVEDPNVLKITHAGDNDYRLLHAIYGTVPQNIFDTQIAAGFVGYRYPISFRKLVEGELQMHLQKGYAVTDWESRPFQPKQLRYALEDVQPLYRLYQLLRKGLERRNRLSWAEEECGQMEDPNYYVRDPHHEAINSNLMRSLRFREKVFLLRLLQWRREQAKRKDYSKEMILPSKLLAQIVKGVRSGKEALQQNRRIPAKTVDRFGDLFVKLYQEKVTQEEQRVLKQIPQDEDEDQLDEILLEFLYLLMKYRSQEEDIAHALVMPRNAIKRMKSNPDIRQNLLGSGWRRQLLGSDFVRWLENYDHLHVSIKGSRIELEILEEE